MAKMHRYSWIDRGNPQRKEVDGETVESVLQVLKTGYLKLYLNAITFWILL